MLNTCKPFLLGAVLHVDGIGRLIVHVGAFEFAPCPYVPPCLNGRNFRFPVIAHSSTTFAPQFGQNLGNSSSLVLQLWTIAT